MDEHENVLKRYAELYPHWSSIRITAKIKSVGGGNYYVVRAKEKNKETEGEICFVGNSSRVTIFSTTEELIRFIDTKQIKWYQHLIAKSGISAIVTIVLLTTLCILVFRKEKPDPEVLQILGGAFLAAIGFLFGTSTNPKS